MFIFMIEEPFLNHGKHYRDSLKHCKKKRKNIFPYIKTNPFFIGTKKSIHFSLLQNATRIVLPLIRYTTIKNESEQFIGHFRDTNFFCSD